MQALADNGVDKDTQSEARETLTAIGLMSGTSMDGIDAALIRTDGGAVIEPIASTSLLYAPAFREQLRKALGDAAPVPKLAEDLTRQHIAVVERGEAPGNVTRFLAFLKYPITPPLAATTLATNRAIHEQPTIYRRQEVAEL